MKKIVSLLATVFVFACMTSCSDSDDKDKKETSTNKEVVGLPSQMSWSTFGVGSSTYVQAAGIADAITTKFGTKIRIIPADTAVGRIKGILNDVVDYTIAADGAYFASFGLYNFSTLDMGPKNNIRALLARPGSATAVTTKASGIKSPKDFKGKRLVWIPGATSVNIKSAAFLAFAGLTVEDAVKVIAPSYKAGVNMIKNGEADWMIGQVTASYWHELNSMGLGVKFIEFPAADEAGWKKLQKVTPWLYPGIAKEGVGFTEAIEIPNYVNPLFVTTSGKSADEVYELVKAMDETFDMYKNIDPLMPGWKIDLSSQYPVQTPYHEGAIKYFKEKGLWTDGHETWNSNYIKELNAVAEAWGPFKEQMLSKNVKDEDVHNEWIKTLKEVLNRDFPQNYNK